MLNFILVKALLLLRQGKHPFTLDHILLFLLSPLHHFVPHTSDTSTLFPPPLHPVAISSAMLPPPSSSATVQLCSPFRLEARSSSHCSTSLYAADVPILHLESNPFLPLPLPASFFFYKNGDLSNFFPFSTASSFLNFLLFNEGLLRSSLLQTTTHLSLSLDTHSARREHMKKQKKWVEHRRYSHHIQQLRWGRPTSLHHTHVHAQCLRALFLRLTCSSFAFVALGASASALTSVLSSVSLNFLRSGAAFSSLPPASANFVVNPWRILGVSGPALPTQFVADRFHCVRANFLPVPICFPFFRSLSGWQQIRRVLPLPQHSQQPLVFFLSRPAIAARPFLGPWRLRRSSPP